MATIEIFETSRKPTAASAANRSGLYARQQFEAGLRWLESRGVHIERHAIALNGPMAIDNGTVKTAIELQGEDSLPIVVLDGTIISIGGHPTRSELMVSAGYKASDDPGFLHEVSVLADNMTAALAANNATKFLLHCDQALSLGLSAEDLRSVVESAKSASRETIRDETLTKVEQFLAFGPAGTPKVPRCSCSEKSKPKCWD
jgi:hypothetical protein